MKELLPITEKNASLTMSSREIAELCEKEHKTVLRDIRVMLIQLYGDGYVEKAIPEHYRNRHSEYIRENADNILNAILGDGTKWHHPEKGYSWERDSRGYISFFRLDKEHSLTLIAGYNVKLRKRIIDRWQELEAKQAVQLPQTFSQALLLAAQLQAEKEQNAPKVEAFNRLVTITEGSMNLTDAAKHLQMQPKAFNQFLSAQRWIYKRTPNSAWTAYQDKLQRGYLEHKANPVKQPDGTEKIYSQVLVTAKGLAKLSAMLNKKVVQ